MGVRMKMRIEVMGSGLCQIFTLKNSTRGGLGQVKVYSSVRIGIKFYLRPVS
jgi:hypothetical protein